MLKSVWETYESRTFQLMGLGSKRAEVERKAKELRSLLEPGIKRVGKKEAVGWIAVDSAFKVVDYDVVAEYLLAVAVVSEEGEEAFGLEENPLETWGLYHLDEEALPRLLEGMALGAELIVGAQRGEGRSRVYLDGSFLTFVVKLNSMLTLAKKGGFRGAEKALSLGDEALRAFGALLRHGGAVACPKLSRKPDFTVHYADLLGELADFGDSLILGAVLEEGEWLEVPKVPTNLRFTLGDERAKEEVQRRLEGLRVYYLKGLSGKVFKFEATGPFDPAEVYPFTGSKELLPLAVADMKARAHLDWLSSPPPLGAMEPYGDRER